MKPDFTGLKKLVAQMGADNSKHWESGDSIVRKERAEFIRRLETTGEEVDFGQIDIREDGLLSLNGEQIVIYIKDNMHIETRAELTPANARKIHFMNCKTIRDMTEKGRHGRYISTQRKTGWYLIDTKWGELELDLDTCKNCLKESNYNNYASDPSSQNGTFKSFNIMEFFETHESKFPFIPKHNEYTAPSSTYTFNWHIISSRYKEQQNWTCEKCKVNLSMNTYKKLLDTHHKSGVKSDNSQSNLEALCKTCHRKEPLHSHMSKKNDEIIKRLRKEQGLPDPD